jgi:hypothetical protein
MLRSKKSQGLSLQTVIIAILCLVVLAIIIYIFSDKIGGVGESLSGCSDKGGSCESSCNGPSITTKDCQDKGQVCCIPLKREDK